MRVTITKNVDAATLAAQLSTALGIDVAVTTRNPGEDDGSGGTLPGVVVLLDAATGDELPGQDAAIVGAVLSAHVVPPPPVTPHRALAKALGTAANLQDIKAALAAFASGVADNEDKVRQAQGRVRKSKPQKGNS